MANPWLDPAVLGVQGWGLNRPGVILPGAFINSGQPQNQWPVPDGQLGHGQPHGLLPTPVPQPPWAAQPLQPPQLPMQWVSPAQEAQMRQRNMQAIARHDCQASGPAGSLLQPAAQPPPPMPPWMPAPGHHMLSGSPAMPPGQQCSPLMLPGAPQQWAAQQQPQRLQTDAERFKLLVRQQLQTAGLHQQSHQQPQPLPHQLPDQFGPVGNGVLATGVATRPWWCARAWQPVSDTAMSASDKQAIALTRANREAWIAWVNVQGWEPHGHDPERYTPRVWQRFRQFIAATQATQKSFAPYEQARQKEREQLAKHQREHSAGIAAAGAVWRSSLPREQSAVRPAAARCATCGGMCAGGGMCGMCAATAATTAAAKIEAERIAAEQAAASKAVAETQAKAGRTLATAKAEVEPGPEATPTGGGGTCDMPGDGATGSAKRTRGERGGRRISKARARKAAQEVGAAAAAPADRTQEPGTSGPGCAGWQVNQEQQQQRDQEQLLQQLKKLHGATVQTPTKSSTTGAAAIRAPAAAVVTSSDESSKSASADAAAAEAALKAAATEEALAELEKRKHAILQRLNPREDRRGGGEKDLGPEQKRHQPDAAGQFENDETQLTEVTVQHRTNDCTAMVVARFMARYDPGHGDQQHEVARFMALRGSWHGFDNALFVTAFRTAHPGVLPGKQCYKSEWSEAAGSAGCNGPGQPAKRSKRAGAVRKMSDNEQCHCDDCTPALEFWAANSDMFAFSYNHSSAGTKRESRGGGRIKLTEHGLSLGVAAAACTGISRLDDPVNAVSQAVWHRHQAAKSLAQQQARETCSNSEQKQNNPGVWLRHNDSVEVLKSGVWCAGTVAAKNSDGTFQIKLEFFPNLTGDGEIGDRIIRAHIRLRQAAGGGDGGSNGAAIADQPDDSSAGGAGDSPPATAASQEGPAQEAKPKGGRRIKHSDDVPLSQGQRKKHAKKSSDTGITSEAAWPAGRRGKRPVYVDRDHDPVKADKLLDRESVANRISAGKAFAAEGLRLGWPKLGLCSVPLCKFFAGKHRQASCLSLCLIPIGITVGRLCCAGASCLLTHPVGMSRRCKNT